MFGEEQNRGEMKIGNDEKKKTKVIEKTEAGRIARFENCRIYICTNLGFWQNINKRVTPW